jgi:cytochrome c biogenesis protein CcdA
MVEVNVLISALVGAGSFFSPCILPILPAFISYLSGTTINEVQSSTANDILWLPQLLGQLITHY